MKTLKQLILITFIPASLWAGQISGLVTSLGAPVKGVKVTLYTGNTAVSAPTLQTNKLDSALSDSTGFYVFAAGGSNPVSGSISMTAGLSGYHTFTQAAFAAQSGAATRNITINRDDSSSTITGKVLKASDNSPIIKAAVVLSGGKLDVARTDSTDSLGNYTFKGIGTSTGYNITVNAPGYSQSSVGSISLGWNSTTTVSPVLLVRSVGTLTGVIRRADSTTKTLAGAKIVLFVSGFKVDSTTSDGAGNYSIQLNAATYTVVTSLAGYRGYKGTSTLDTSATVSFGTSTILNVFLTPATGSMFGLVVHNSVANPPITAGGVDSAKVYLERRRSAGAGFNTWTLCDSTTTDVTGYYSFSGIIAATGGNGAVPVYGVSYANPNGSYRLQVKPLKAAVGGVTYPANYDTTALVTSISSTTVYTVAFAPNSTTNNANITLTTVLPIIGQVLQGKARDVHFLRAGGQLVLELAPSTFSRVVQAFDLRGTLQGSFQVPANESKVSIPESFSPEKGFLFSLR